MAIKPYVSQSKVTPIAGVDTSGINRVANIQANSMLGAARVLDTIGEMAFQEGKKERIKEGTLDAASAKLGRNEHGEPILPDSIPSDNTFYGEAYQNALYTRYGSEVEIDLANRFQTLAGEMTYDSPKTGMSKAQTFMEAATLQLNATIENVDPNVRDSVRKYGIERIRQHHSYIDNAEKKAEFNQANKSNGELITQRYGEVMSLVREGEPFEAVRLSPQYKRFTTAIGLRRQFIGTANANNLLHKYDVALVMQEVANRFYQIKDDKGMTTEQAALKRKEFLEKILTKNMTIGSRKKGAGNIGSWTEEQRNGLVTLLKSYDSAMINVSTAQNNYISAQLLEKLAGAAMSHGTEDAQTKMTNLFNNTRKEIFKSTGKMPSNGQLLRTVSGIIADQERHKNLEWKTDTRNRLINARADNEENRKVIIKDALHLLKEDHPGEFENIKANLRDMKGSQGQVDYLRQVLKTTGLTADRVQADYANERLKLNIKNYGRELGRNVSARILQIAKAGDPIKEERRLKQFESELVKELNGRTAHMNKLAPLLRSFRNGRSVPSSKTNGDLFIPALRFLGVDNPTDPDVAFAHVRMGIPTYMIEAMLDGLRGVNSNNLQAVDQAMAIFNRYKGLQGGIEHLSAQLGSDYAVFHNISIMGLENHKKHMDLVQKASRGDNTPFGGYKNIIPGYRTINDEGEEIVDGLAVKAAFNNSMKRVNKDLLDGYTPWISTFPVSLLDISSHLPDSEKENLKYKAERADKSPVPFEFKRQAEKIWLASLHHFKKGDEITDEEMDEAMKYAVHTAMSSRVSNWGYTMAMKGSGNFGELNLVQNAPNRFFAIDTADGPSTNWIFDATNKMVAKTADPRMNKGKLVLGYNYFLEDNGKKSPAGTPIYDVRTWNDEVAGDFMRDKRGKIVEVDLFSKWQAKQSDALIEEQLRKADEQEKIHKKAAELNKQFFKERGRAKAHMSIR